MRESIRGTARLAPGVYERGEERMRGDARKYEERCEEMRGKDARKYEEMRGKDARKYEEMRGEARKKCPVLIEALCT